MNKANNVTNISERLLQDRKERNRACGVLFAKDFEVEDKTSAYSAGIEVYKGENIGPGLYLSIDKTSALIMLTVNEAVELGEAILLAACRDGNSQ